MQSVEPSSERVHTYTWHFSLQEHLLTALHCFCHVCKLRLAGPACMQSDCQTNTLLQPPHDYTVTQPQYEVSAAEDAYQGALLVVALRRYIICNGIPCCFPRSTSAATYLACSSSTLSSTLAVSAGPNTTLIGYGLCDIKNIPNQRLRPLYL